jgi:hypothetical protein
MGGLTAEQSAALQEFIAELRAGKGGHEEFAAMIRAKIVKAQEKGKSEAEIEEMVRREERAYAYRQVIGKGKEKARAVRKEAEAQAVSRVAAAKGGEPLNTARLREGVAALRGAAAEKRRILDDFSKFSVAETDPKPAGVSVAGGGDDLKGVSLELPVGLITFADRGTTGNQISILINGKKAEQSDWRDLVKMVQQIDEKYGADAFVGVKMSAVSRIRQGISNEKGRTGDKSLTMKGLGLSKYLPPKKVGGSRRGSGVGG